MFVFCSCVQHFGLFILTKCISSHHFLIRCVFLSISRLQGDSDSSIKVLPLQPPGEATDRVTLQASCSSCREMLAPCATTWWEVIGCYRWGSKDNIYNRGKGPSSADRRDIQ